MKNLTTKPDSTELVPTDDLNEAQWETNQAKISQAIYDYVVQYASMPPKSFIAEITGLTRRTVSKHMEAAQANLLKSEQRGLGLMTNHVMASVLKSAIQGDLQAAKIFLDRNGAGPEKTSSPEKIQNNYVQINKTVINQQVLQQLRPDDLQQIEQIIANSLNRSKADTETEAG